MDVRSAGLALSQRRPHRRLVRLGVVAAVVVAMMVSIASLAWAATPSFPDVPATHSYYAAITDLASRGIIGGYENGSFGPDDLVTRQQFAKMIVLAGAYPVSENDICPFADVTKGDGSTFFPDNFIAVCAAKGITKGISPTTFNPSGKITRHQVVSMVVRMADDLQPGLIAAPSAAWTGSAAWAGDPVHGANAARAEYNALLTGLDLTTLGPTGNMSRGEVAQVLHNLLGKLASSTTTTISTTTTSTSTTSTTTNSTTTTTEAPRKWTNLHVGGEAPLARAAHAMVYGGTTGKVVLFGGEDRYRFFKDIWSYDPTAGAWTDLTPLGTVPSGRVGCALAYDPVTNVVILFGGNAGDDYGAYFNDTWSFNLTAGTWTKLQPAGSLPSARAGHSMVYDPVGRKVILFGSGSASAQNDTWAYDPAANTWSNLHPSGEVPSARSLGSMVYDQVARKIILFGGVGEGLVFDDQTWAYDPAANAWKNLHPAGSPQGRAGLSMAYDEAAGATVLHGGTRLSGLDLILFGDTWTYDSTANTWTRVRPTGDVPDARCGHGLVYDPVTRKVILFGGTTGLSYLNDTWSYGR